MALACSGATTPDASSPPASTVSEVALAPVPTATPAARLIEPPAPVASSSPPPTDAAAPPSGTGSFFEVVPGPGQKASATPAVPPSSGPPKSLDASSAAEAIAAIRPGFQQCLRDQLEVTPGMTGTMSIDVDIQGNGSVGKVHSSAKNVPRPVIDCVIGIVKSTRFPLPPGGKVTTLNIPITFTR